MISASLHPVQLRDQHVLITGGSSGIGLALAQRAVAAGARVSLVARDPAKLAAAATSLRDATPGATVFTTSADVARENEVNTALAAAALALGPDDVLITSAGIVLAATFMVLGVLPLVFLREIGFAVAIGVIIDTFIIRSTLVPALAYDIGRKIWWPGKLAKQPELARLPASGLADPVLDPGR